jgi:hypothetical protein
MIQQSQPGLMFFRLRTQYHKPVVIIARTVNTQVTATAIGPRPGSLGLTGGGIPEGKAMAVPSGIAVGWIQKLLCGALPKAKF